MAKFKVYYTIELNEVATHIFESNDFEVKLCSHNDEETYVKELAEFQPDAIMCRTEPITAKMMDTCKNLKVIGKQGAGLDNIDMDHAHAKDITVVYAPAGNANAVAEHAVMLMLMCAKRFTYVDRQFRGGNFLVRMGMEHTYELGGTYPHNCGTARRFHCRPRIPAYNRSFPPRFSASPDSAG